MKKMKIPFLILFAAASFMACKKDSQVNIPGLDASKTNAIKKGEPVLFTLDQASAGSTVNWTVSPSANTQIKSSGNQASILFGVKGNYVVTAVAGNVSASTPVSVSDSVYNGGGSGGGGGETQPTTLNFSAGEKINIQVSRIDSGATSGLIFSTITSNEYTCLTNSLISTFTAGTNSFDISFDGVSVPANCTTGTAKASAFAFYYPVSEGTSSLTIHFNGTNYTGTIVKTGNSYQINWSYATGVVISPASL